MQARPVRRPPVLAHPRRQAILAYLGARRSASLGDLREHLETSSSVAAWHVRQLLRVHAIRRLGRGDGERFAVELAWPPQRKVP